MNVTIAAHKRILILDESVDVAELESLASASGWTRSARFPQSFDDHLEVQWTTDAAVDVAYIEFHSDGVRMVSVRGDDTATVEAATDTVTATVTTRDADRLLANVCADPGPRPEQLVRDWRELNLVCALCDPDQPMDERLPSALESALAHHSRQVRFRALMVADALGGRWPRLLDLVVARKDIETELDHLIDVFAQAHQDASD